MFRNRVRRLHFVGIGGIGMSGIAEVLLTQGFAVSGSDLQRNATTDRLAQMGITLFSGHEERNVHGADVVVISSAVKADNVEVKEARRLGVPVIPRAEMLAELMRLKYGIAVAGTHGKTTTTSLVAAILTHANLDPTVVIGGKLKSIRSNARLGAGEYLVAEADESDGSFLRLAPTVAVVTNIELEHLDHWSEGMASLSQAFLRFINGVPFYGAAVLCLDHPQVQALLPQVDKRHLTYGFAPQAHFVAENLQMAATSTSFDLRRFGELKGRVTVGLIGRHNVLNALASLAVADELGVDFAVAAEALQAFDGVGRRFEIKGETGGILVVDDYGHHPTEIRATLRAARDAYPSRRVVAAFQPHRYTRTRDFLPAFAGSFNDCHVLLVTDTYAAGEAPIDRADASAVVEQVVAYGHRDASYTGSLAQTVTSLRARVAAGDLVITFGAGNVWQVGEQLLQALATQA